MITLRKVTDPQPRPAPPHLEQARLFTALARATITPFTESDWSCWGGAVGEPSVVQWHPRDADYFRQALGIQHWDPMYTTVVLDDSGLTWNGSSPVNSYAWEVCVSAQVSMSDTGTPEEVWEQTGSGSYEDKQIASLPAEVREMILACPVQARPMVIQGYLAGTVDRRLLDALELLEQVDFGPHPGLHAAIPWERLEHAAKGRPLAP